MPNWVSHQDEMLMLFEDRDNGFNTGGFDPPNVCIGLSALLVAIPYAVIYSKLDIVYMKNQIISLFDLWNNRDE